jgi:hypothetical protein
MAEKLMVVTSDQGVEIIGNRAGLRGLAEVALQLANCPRMTRRPGNLEPLPL